MSLVFLNYSTETFSPAVGGSLSTYIWELCRCASREGIEPTVITRSHDALKYDWAKTIYVPPPELPSNHWLFKWERVKRKISRWPHLRHEEYARRVVEVVRKSGLQESSFVLQNDVELAIYLRQRFPKMPILLLFQNYHRIKPFFSGKLSESSIVVAAVSRATGSWVEQVYGLPVGSVATVYNGIDTERFAPAKVLPSGPPVINFTGRISPEKAPDVILRAALAVARNRQDFSLQLLGWRESRDTHSSPFDRELDALAKELERMGVRVRRGGLVARDKLPAELHRASIHVTPSRWEEPCAFVNFEGMASGLAVVGSRTGGTPEIIGDAGLLFDRDASDKLAEHLERLIAEPKLREDFGRRGRERMLQFSWDHTWKKIRGLAGV